MKKTTRRTFLQMLGLGSASILAPSVLPARALGLDGNTAPSSKITLGGIGLWGRGTHDLNSFLSHEDVQVLAVCDVQSCRREACKKLVDDHYKDQSCAAYIDMMELYERKDIDAVLIATGNRWHALASIRAARAGKDIYCEKPVSMTVQEARALERAINHYDVIFQAGTQRRNNDNFQFAVHLAQSGQLGKLTEVHANIMWPGTRFEWYPGEPEPDPSVCDWDKFLGPAPWRPYNSRYVRNAGWYRIDDFEGEMPGWASHTLDMCQWAAQKDDTMPVEWFPCFDEKGNQTWEIQAKYADGLKLVMRPNAYGWLGLGSCAIRLVGEDGWVETGDSCKVAVSNDRLRKQLRPFHDGISEVKHVTEFLECVRTRRTPTSNIRVTAQSHVACHCSSICWKLGRELKFNLATETFHDREADGLLQRAQREPYTF